MVQTPGFKNQLSTFFLCLPRSTQLLFILPTENHSFLPCRPWTHRQTREHECRGSSAASHLVLEKAHTDAGLPTAQLHFLLLRELDSAQHLILYTDAQGIRLFTRAAVRAVCRSCAVSRLLLSRERPRWALCWLPNALPTSQSCAIVRQPG